MSFVLSNVVQHGVFIIHDVTHDMIAPAKLRLKTIHPLFERRIDSCEATAKPALEKGDHSVRTFKSQAITR